MKRKIDLTTRINKHHIIPRFRCKELGIHPDDPVNDTVKVSQLEHANIHWELSLGITEKLLSYCTPTQFQLDNLCLGDKRHGAGASMLAEGMIDGIDQSGENHPFYGKKHTEETKNKMSMNKMGNTNCVGRILSEEHRNVFTFEGRKHTEETIKKMKKARIGINVGRKHTEEELKKMSESQKGKKLSKEHKKNMSDALMGRVISPEWRKKISESQKRRWEYKNYEEYEEMK